MIAMPVSAIRSATRRSKRLSSRGTVAINDTPKPVIASSNGASPRTMNTTWSPRPSPSERTHWLSARLTPRRSMKITKARPGTITNAVLANSTAVSRAAASTLSGRHASAAPASQSTITSRVPAIAA
ncbi:hypothetical protein D3C75_1041710 [compost metagenome]